MIIDISRMVHDVDCLFAYKDETFSRSQTHINVQFQCDTNDVL